MNIHFSTPPYSILAMKDPGVHKIFDTDELNSNIILATSVCHDDNPLAVQAIIAADPEKAAEICPGGG